MVQVGTRKNRDLPNYDALIQQVKLMWQQGMDDAAIAAELTTIGYHSARSDHVSAASVGRLRLAYRWQRVSVRDYLSMEGHLSVQELADLLGVTRSWLYGRIRRGTIPAEFITRHPEYDRLFVRNDPNLLVSLRDMKKNARSQ